GDVNWMAEEYFRWCVEHMADLCIRLATAPPPQGTELRWSRWLGGGGEVAGEALTPTLRGSAAPILRGERGGAATRPAAAAGETPALPGAGVGVPGPSPQPSPRARGKRGAAAPAAGADKPPPAGAR